MAGHKAQTKNSRQASNRETQPRLCVAKMLFAFLWRVIFCFSFILNAKIMQLNSLDFGVCATAMDANRSVDWHPTGSGRAKMCPWFRHPCEIANDTVVWHTLPIHIWRISDWSMRWTTKQILEKMPEIHVTSTPRYFAICLHGSRIDIINAHTAWATCFE